MYTVKWTLEQWHRDGDRLRQGPDNREPSRAGWATRREAVAEFEMYHSLLIDKMAGRL